MRDLKIVRIEYTLKAGVDVQKYVGYVEGFVRGIGGLEPKPSYTSFQHEGEPRRFTHVGEFAEEAVAKLQAEPFFKQFSAFLRENCAAGPEVVTLRRVAST